MRPAFLCSPLALILLTSTLHAQDLSDAYATLPLDDEFPSLRPQIPRPATQPTTQPAPAEQASYLLDDPWHLRTRLIDLGITPAANTTLDLGKNFAGGRSTRGSAFESLLNLSLSLDSEKLAHLPGGTAYFNFQIQHGTSASDEAATLQNVDSIYADGRSQLSEAWYQQSLLDKKWLVKAGKIDAGADFAFSDFAADFRNVGMVYTFANPFLPTYPDPSLGVDTFLYPSDHLYLAAGIFDGALASNTRTGETGPRSAFNPPSDTYVIAEAGLTWQVRKLSGRLKLGAWTESSSPDSWGPYLVLDQKLLRFNPSDDTDDRGLGAFLILDHADQGPVSTHLATGLALKGPLPSRPADTLALGLTQSHLPTGQSPESALETFYKIQLTPYLTLQPDLQYILHPAYAPHDSALVAGVRIKVTF